MPTPGLVSDLFLHLLISLKHTVLLLSSTFLFFLFFSKVKTIIHIKPQEGPNLNQGDRLCPRKSLRSHYSTAPHCDQEPCGLLNSFHEHRHGSGRKKRTNITPCQLCLHIHRQILLGNDKEQLKQMDFRDMKRLLLPP